MKCDLNLVDVNNKVTVLLKVLWWNLGNADDKMRCDLNLASCKREM